MKEQIFEKEKVHFNLAKDKKFGITFEVPVNPELAIEFKKGKDISIHDIVKAEEIFSDSQKGLLAKEDDLKKVFGTTDPLEVAKELILHGEIQLTQKQREEMREIKRKRIVSLITLHASDAQTGLPIPPARIEAAMEQERVKIDEFHAPEDQMGRIIKELRTILPLKVEKKKLHVTIPALHTGKAYGALKNIADLQNERWNSDGSFECTIEVPAGIEADLYEKMNKATDNEIQIEEI